MTNFDKLYLEIANKIADNLPNIDWIDLWHNQVNFLDDEHPFPTPAVFLSFRSTSSDLSESLQTNELQVGVYLFHETFADTYLNSINQDSALKFTQSISDIHKLFHDTEGNNYAEMSHRSTAAVDTGSAGNLYRLVFTANQINEPKQEAFIPVDTGLKIVPGVKPINEQSNLFTL